MVGTAGELARFLILLAFIVAAAISGAAARPISSPRIGRDRHPCSMTTVDPTARPSTATTETSAPAGRAAVLGNRYGPLLFVSLPKGAVVPPSTPRNIGHDIKT